MDERERRAALRQILSARDHWEVLDLSRGRVELKLVRERFKRLARLVHTDKYKEPNAKSAMQRLNEALEVLSDTQLTTEVNSTSTPLAFFSSLYTS